MARRTVPSSPKELIPTPFVEVLVSQEELDLAYFSRPQSRTANVSFMDMALLFTRFLKTARLVSGDRDAVNKLYSKISTHNYEDAASFFSALPPEGFTLQFSWVAPFGDVQRNELWKSMISVYGIEFVNTVSNLFDGPAVQVLNEAWLGGQEAMSKITLNFRAVTGEKPVRVDCITQDIWFPSMDQGIRVDPLTQKFEDLSDAPIGADVLSKYKPDGTHFSPGYNTIPHRNVTGNLTLAGNLVYNMALNYAAGRLSNLNSFVTDFRNNPEDNFYTRIRTNLPLGAFLGNPITTTGYDSPPVVLLHNNPGILYQVFKEKLAGRDNLRQQGVFAPPSSEARRTGSAANLELVGKKAVTSRYRKGQGYLLYDRETATTLKGALRVEDEVFHAHEIFEEYLEWYKDRRKVAAQIMLRAGEPPPQWGKWGFNPWQFSQFPENARVFVKMKEE